MNKLDIKMGGGTLLYGGSSNPVILRSGNTFGKDVFLKYLLSDISFRLNKFNMILGENGSPILNNIKLASELGIGYRLYLRKSKNFSRDDFFKKTDKGIIVNPKILIHPEFKFNSKILDLFPELEEDIDYLSNYVADKKDFASLKEVLKKYLPPSKYDFMNFKFGDKKYSIFDYPMPKAGVYLLIKDNNIIYIGKSKNIKNRISQHKSCKDFDKVKSIIFSNKGNIDLYEPYLINKYKPILNREFNNKNTMLSLPEIEWI